MQKTAVMTRRAALAIVPLALALGGCAVDQPPSTPYKGNAVWNVASNAAPRATTAHDR